MKKPLRVCEGSAKPFEAFWRVVDAASSDSGEAEIEFYGPISEFSWWGDEITPANFKADLFKLGNGGPVTVRLNSPGGDAWAASVIRSIIMEYSGRVTVRIDGLCASAATIVATAGDVVKMQDSAFFMIHDPWTIAMGGVEDLKAAIDMLKTTKAGIVDTYISKTHMAADQLAKMMANETWMTAQQAKEYGFVDEVITASSKVLNLAGSQRILNMLTDFENVPPELMASLQLGAVTDEGTQPSPQPSPLEGEGVREREVQSLRNFIECFG